MSSRSLTLTLAAVAAAAVPAGVLPVGVLAATSAKSLPARTVVAHAGALTTSQQRATARYWTRARMKAAIPAETAAPADSARSARSALPSRSAAGTTASAASAAARGAWLDGDSDGDGLRWVHGGAVEQTTGKVFFTLDGTDYVCSGTAIRSPQADIVLTAAHCVADSEQDWATNWTFVPGYQDGAQPYGAFTAQRFFVSPQWAGSGSDTPQAEEYDVAFVTVNPATSSSASARLPAGQPIAFGDAPGTATRTYVFGYPSEPPFTGLYPNYCAGSTLSAQMDGTAGLRCVMTAGDSGGPWLAGFDPRTGTGTVVAVTTFKYDGDSSVLYGTALGPAARELYEEASSSLTPDPSLARP